MALGRACMVSLIPALPLFPLPGLSHVVACYHMSPVILPAFLEGARRLDDI